MFAVFRRHGRGSIALTTVEIYLANCENLVSSSLPISSYMHLMYRLYYSNHIRCNLPMR